MLKRLFWNISILIISLCFLCLAILKFIDRDLFLQKSKIEHYTSETFLIYTDIQKILQEQVLDLFNIIDRVIEHTDSTIATNSLNQLLSSKNSITPEITIKTRSNNKILFTNQEQEKLIPYPCNNTFYYVPEKNISILCKQTQNHIIYLGISLQQLLIKLQKSLINTYPVDQLPMIKNIILSDKNIAVNIDNATLISNKNIILNVYELLDINANFVFKIQGNYLYKEKLTSLNYMNKQEIFYLFYDPLIKERNLTLIDILFISLLIILSLVTLLLGFQLSRNYNKDYYLNSFSLDHHLSKQEERIDLLEPIEKTVTSLPSRDLPELRNLITEVTEQEKKTVSSSVLIKEILNYDSLDEDYLKSWKNISQKYSKIAYTLKCTQKQDTLVVQGISRTARDFEYQIPMEKFYIPYLMQENQKYFYVYKEAGKTSPIKSLLIASFINPMDIEGALFIQLSNNPHEYIIHLFFDEINHDEYQEIFDITLKSN